MKKVLFFCFFFFALEALFAPLPTSSYKTLYKSLKKDSVAQHLAFYELYPDSSEGKMALKQAFALMKQEEKIDIPLLFFPTTDISALVSLAIQPPEVSLIELEDQTLEFIEKLGKNLSNRKLKTFNCFEEKKFLEADPEEIDLARALFVAQMEDTPANRKKIRTYEALLDLMSLEILAKLPEKATCLEKIAAINSYIFFEKGYRFPPHSEYAKEIDTYTFLSTVMEKRQGVCLGVTILYMSIAQRIDLPLVAITPPGHILPQYIDENKKIHNIETTARGLSFPMEVYLGVETPSIAVRNRKEVVGLAFINEASIHFAKKEFQKAVILYEKAIPYLPQDPLLKELLGYHYLFMKETKKGKALLKEVLKIDNPHSIGKNTLIEDYLDNKVDSEGILAIFLPVDEKRSSILKKQNELKSIMKKYPKFRSGYFQLASTYLQLGRDKEALNLLLEYDHLDSEEPVVNYYLAALFFERKNYPKSWEHLLKAEKLLAEKNHHPKALKELKKELLLQSPPPRESLVR